MIIVDVYRITLIFRGSNTKISDIYIPDQILRFHLSRASNRAHDRLLLSDWSGIYISLVPRLLFGGGGGGGGMRAWYALCSILNVNLREICGCDVA